MVKKTEIWHTRFNYESYKELNPVNSFVSKDNQIYRILDITKSHGAADVIVQFVGCSPFRRHITYIKQSENDNYKIGQIIDIKDSKKRILDIKDEGSTDIRILCEDLITERPLTDEQFYDKVHNFVANDYWHYYYSIPYSFDFRFTNVSNVLKELDRHELKIEDPEEYVAIAIHRAMQSENGKWLTKPVNDYNGIEFWPWKDKNK